MTLPTTSLAFSALQTEFGGANPISLSEYYRSGSYVPTGTTSSYGTIPTSGQISLGVFRGTQKVTYLDLQTVTPDIAIVFAGDFSSVVYYHGYATNNALGGYPIGSISDGTSNIYGGAAVEGVYTSDSDPNNPDNDIYVYFAVAGSRANSGWTSMSINGEKTYYRSSAGYANYGSITYWSWLDMEGTDPINYGPGTTEVIWN